jgi:hypothetical protein
MVDGSSCAVATRGRLRGGGQLVFSLGVGTGVVGRVFGCYFLFICCLWLCNGASMELGPSRGGRLWTPRWKSVAKREGGRKAKL